MVDIRIARPFQQADAYVSNSGARTRPVVAALDRLAGTVGGVWRQNAADEEADREAAHRIEMERLERERTATIANGLGGVAEMRERWKAGITELRTAPGAQPDAAGHGDQVAAMVDKDVAEFMAKLGPDPEVLNRFGPMLRQDAAQVIGGERTWEIMQKAQHGTNNFKKFEDSEGIEIQKVPTRENLALREARLIGMINALPIPEAAREVMRRETGQFLRRTLLDAWIAGGDSAGVRSGLDGGEFDAWLDPKMKEAYYKSADLVDQAAERAAERAEREEMEAAAAGLDELAARQDAGESVSPVEIRRAVDRATAAGVDTAKVIRSQTALEDGVVMPEFSLAADPDGSKSLAEGARVQQAIAAGEKVAPIAARNVDKLLKQGRERAGHGGASLKGLSEEAALERLAALPPAQRHAAAEGYATGFGGIAALPTKGLQLAAAEGRRVLKDRPTLLQDKMGRTKADGAYEAIVGRAGRVMGGQFGEKREVAKWLYARWAQENGVAHFNAAKFAEYVSIAFGATVRPKDGTYQGGLGTVNGQTVILPDRSTSANLRAAIARFDWSVTRFHNGNAATKHYVTRNMFPEWVGETEDHIIYNMVDLHGNVLLDRKGNAFGWKVSKEQPR